MIITRTVTKKVLENIVHQTFSNFGMISSSALLDSLKFLGFYYATNAGISINIEDLKTPKIKKDFLDDANQEMKYVSEQWQRGFVSDTERFQTIMTVGILQPKLLRIELLNIIKILTLQIIYILWRFQEREEICPKYVNL